MAEQRFDGALIVHRRRISTPPWPAEVDALRYEAFPIWFAEDVAGLHAYGAHDVYLVTAEVDRRFVGYAYVDDGLQPGNCYLREIAVSPKERCHGVGRRLVVDLVAWLRDEGYGMIYVYPLEDEGFEGRVRWFESMGFRQPDRDTTHSAHIGQLVESLTKP